MKRKLEYVIIYGNGYVCNFNGWDRRKLLENSLETKAGPFGLSSGYLLSLKKENAALFSTISDAYEAISKFKLESYRCKIIEYFRAPYEL